MWRGGSQQSRLVVSPRSIDGRSDPYNEASLHEHLLAGVSSPFALTIPQLPDGLRETVTNAYLLCRIAALSNPVIRSNFGLTSLFKTAARGLPLHNGNGPATTKGKETTIR